MPYKRGSKRKAPSTKAPSTKAPSTKAPSTKARATQARRTPDSDKQAPAEPSSSEPSAGTTLTDQPRVLRQSSKKQEIATEEARQLREQVEKLKKQLKNAKAKAPPRNSVTQARSDDYADQPSPVESEEGSEVDDNRLSRL